MVADCLKHHLFALLSVSTLLIGSGGCSDSDLPAGSLDTAAESLMESPRESSGDSTPANSEATPIRIGTASDPSWEFAEPPLSQEEIEAGWVSLFDGRTLFGWLVPEDTNWRVEDGVIIADEGAISLLETPFRLRDFELRFSAQLEPGGNSGVFLRSADSVKSPVTDTYELNLCNTHESFGTGSLVGRVVSDRCDVSEGEFHDWRVRAEGPRIQVWVNDQRVLDFTDESEHLRTVGRLGLQKNSGEVRFRNIAIRPLDTRPLIASDWHPVPGSQSEFSVEEDVISVVGGPGFYETNDQWADFFLSFQVRTNKPSLNSGVFFRALTGTEEHPSNGYEFQIQNGFSNQDRTQPEDSGTGAIFRRQPARYVVGNDGEWVTGVLIADRDWFSTWVNGYQVVSWQDTRPADENPRRGSRLQPGHLLLQGHDPTTDVNFRNLQLSNLSVVTD